MFNRVALREFAITQNIMALWVKAERRLQQEQTAAASHKSAASNSAAASFVVTNGESSEWAAMQNFLTRQLS